MTYHFNGHPLRVELIEPDYRSAILLEPIHVYYDDSPLFVVPKGFCTDFASIPRVLWRIWPPQGPYAPAAVVHDYLYSLNGQLPPDPNNCFWPLDMPTHPRSVCDLVFLDLMKCLKCSWVTRHALYRGVRIGGWKAWNDHKEAREKERVREEN